jgi:hypothetical protein
LGRERHIIITNAFLHILFQGFYVSFKEWSAAQDAANNKNKANDTIKRSPATGQLATNPDETTVEIGPVDKP